jgi:site-specific DNA-cytosine methylase
MKILVACEESQAVTIEFRKLGQEAYSCDVEPCSGGHPEWHLQQDVVPLLREKWDMIIAFPPCTHLSNAGALKWKEKQENGLQELAIGFFMRFVYCDCPRVAIENPLGIMSRAYRRSDQIIQPWQFGDRAQKRTCLWLKGLPPLEHTEIVDKGDMYIVTRKSGARAGQRYAAPLWYQQAAGMNPIERAKIRSKTFTGIARAMAEQWSDPNPRYYVPEQLSFFSEFEGES